VTAGGKLFLAGLAITLAGGGLLAARGGLSGGLAGVQANPAAGLIATGVALAVLGCAVYVAQPALDTGLARRVPFATMRTSLAMLVLAVAAANIVSLPVLAFRGRGLAVGGPGEDSLGPLGLALLIAASELPIIGVVWLRIVLPGCLSWRSLGLSLRPAGQHLGTGVAGGVALFFAAGIVGALLTRLGVRQNQFERFAGIEGAPLGLFVVAVLAGSVLAPFAEELFFRGYIFQTFRDRYGAWWAYLFSAGLFAAVHANLAAAAPIFVLGLMLAYIFQRSGSIVPGIIAHGVNNAIAFCLLYSGIRG
jgi:uncharacterized protein